MHSSINRTIPNISLPPFNPSDFEVEQFLHGVESDTKSLIWCIKNALLTHHDIECWEDPFAFCDYSTDLADLSAWAIIDLHAPRDRSISFVVSAIKKNGVRLYSFETDDGVVGDVQLQGNEAAIFDFLICGILRHFI